MWIAGITQGLMWRAFDKMGFLQYSFIETVLALHPMYVTRAIGGLFFLAGAVIMCYNLYKTVKSSDITNSAIANSADGQNAN